MPSDSWRTSVLAYRPLHDYGGIAEDPSRVNYPDYPQGILAHLGRDARKERQSAEESFVSWQRSQNRIQSRGNPFVLQPKLNPPQYFAGQNHSNNINVSSTAVQQQPQQIRDEKLMKEAQIFLSPAPQPFAPDFPIEARSNRTNFTRNYRSEYLHAYSQRAETPSTIPMSEHVAPIVPPHWATWQDQVRNGTATHFGRKATQSTFKENSSVNSILSGSQSVPIRPSTTSNLPLSSEELPYSVARHRSLGKYTSPLHPNLYLQFNGDGNNNYVNVLTTPASTQNSISNAIDRGLPSNIQHRFYRSFQFSDRPSTSVLSSVSSPVSVQKKKEIALSPPLFAVPPPGESWYRNPIPLSAPPPPVSTKKKGDCHCGCGGCDEAKKSAKPPPEVLKEKTIPKQTAEVHFVTRA